jgi:hypothetical protein
VECLFLALNVDRNDDAAKWFFRFVCGLRIPAQVIFRMMEKGTTETNFRGIQSRVWGLVARQPAFLSRRVLSSRLYRRVGLTHDCSG